MRGTTYQRKDGRWECRVSLGSENGCKKYRSFYGKTKDEAEYKMAVAFQNNICEDKTVTEITVKELAIEWLCVVKSRIKESTAANYRMKIERHILPYFGDISSAMLKAKTVSEFVQRKLQADRTENNAVPFQADFEKSKFAVIQIPQPAPFICDRRYRTRF